MMKLPKIMTDFTHITLSMHFAIQYRETSDGLLLALPLLSLSLSLSPSAPDGQMVGVIEPKDLLFFFYALRAKSINRLQV